jgi:hypothetical protein
MSKLYNLFVSIRTENQEVDDLEESANYVIYERMYNNEVESILFDYGIDRSLKHFDDSYGLDSLPKENYSRALLACVVKDLYPAWIINHPYYDESDSESDSDSD